MSKLTKEEINSALTRLIGWNYQSNSIVKEFEFKDFTRSIGFVTQVGIEAEKADHHPDILIHSWNKVKVTLSTHSAGGLTQKDISLAEIIDSF
ncbi:MAG TPA: 4a-hydroxytetrahydrobiopterin dehydratase [Ignavibacteria bacterium]|nr:4a-hydroxytetrahydrobiopterin dehydratase [Ignavibacteria bacterium]